MLLKNLIYIFSAGLNRSGGTLLTFRGGGTLDVYNWAAQTSLKYDGNAIGSKYQSNYTSTYYPEALCIGVGTGTTPANYLDNDLETGGIGIKDGTAKVSDGKIIISAAYTPTEDTTITEIGVFAGRQSGYTSYGIMLTRTVFDTPVTIKANTTKTFSITIDCNKFSEGYTIN